MFNSQPAQAIFCGDDAFDTDQGYRGKMQFILCIAGSTSHHCAEMDGMKGASTPRSFPKIYGATFIGGGDDHDGKGHAEKDAKAALLHVREATGGEFANMVLTHGKYYGVVFVSSAAPATRQPRWASVHACMHGALAPWCDRRGTGRELAFWH